MSVYFGGSRHLGNLPIVGQVVVHVLQSQSVHVGCQFGADHQVIMSVPWSRAGSLSVFAVAPNQASAPAPVLQAVTMGASVTYSAGGTSAPIPARYLLRSIAAFQGCTAAVFFQPGHGSLAVARECVRSGVPVFAFNPTAGRKSIPPASIPSVSGQWVRSIFFGQFLCWRWSYPAQLSLF